MNSYKTWYYKYKYEFILPKYEFILVTQCTCNGLTLQLMASAQWKCLTADNNAAHTRIQIDLSAKDANSQAASGDYKTMYKRERLENEKLRTQLKDSMISTYLKLRLRRTSADMTRFGIWRRPWRKRNARWLNWNICYLQLWRMID